MPRGTVLIPIILVTHHAIFRLNMTELWDRNATFDFVIVILPGVDWQPTDAIESITHPARGSHYRRQNTAYRWSPHSYPGQSSYRSDYRQ